MGAAVADSVALSNPDPSGAAKAPHSPNPLSPTALPPAGREGAQSFLVFFQTNLSLFSRLGGGRWEKRAGVMRVFVGEAMLKSQ